MPWLRISRRRFLRLLGSATGIGVLTALGYAASHRQQKAPIPVRSSDVRGVNTTRLSNSTTNLALLITNRRSTNPFGHYLGELLRAEGLTMFQTADISGVDSAMLQQFPLAVLTEGTLSSQEVVLLEDYVSGGGHLIAMRPDAGLASLLGVERVPGAIADGYVLVGDDKLGGGGITTQTLQFRGEADSYVVAGAEAVAWLYRDANTPTSLPAVTIHHYGRGSAAAWAFDLARSVAYLRQGNAPSANQERDGLEGVRASDMFVGWIDLHRIGIPQADELQRFLAKLIKLLLGQVLPLPWLWYLPAGADGMLVVTSDSHGNPTWMIEDLLRRVEQRGGHASVYYAPAPPPSSSLLRVARDVRRWAGGLPLIGAFADNPNDAPTTAQVSAWRARGHEFGIHPYVEGGVEEGYRQYIDRFEALGYGPVPPTVRTHRVLWSGWVETARTQAAHGLRMNFDYYHVGPAFRDGNGRWAYGYFTGSALPIRFVDEQGQVLNIYQQLTALVDEHLLQIWPDGSRMSPAQAVAVSQEVLRRSIDNGYGPIVVQFHADFYNPANRHYADSTTWAESILDYAVAHRAPIWSAERWLAFVEARNNAVLSDVRWNDPKGWLTFRVTSDGSSGADLAMMLPLIHGSGKLIQVLIDGAPAEARERAIGGIDYAEVAVPTGHHLVAAIYAVAIPAQ